MKPTKANSILSHSFLSEAEAHQPVASPLDLAEAVMGCFLRCLRFAGEWLLPCDSLEFNYFSELCWPYETGSFRFTHWVKNWSKGCVSTWFSEALCARHAACPSQEVYPLGDVFSHPQAACALHPASLSRLSPASLAILKHLLALDSAPPPGA